MERGIERILVSEQDIAATVARLGREITAHYREAGGELLVVGLLRGSFVFMADLVRQIRLPLAVDFMIVSSYGTGTTSSGEVQLVMDCNQSIAGKDVLLVEDIVDTGRTLVKVLELLRLRGPRSLKVCSFLSKPSRRQVEVAIDFCGCTIPDEFACGYGLDYAGKYRNLPYVGVLEQT